MALNYTLKKSKVMDGDDLIATVRGLSLNDIVELISMNKEAMESLFNQFAERDPNTITEGEIVQTGMGLLSSAPMLIAQIIAVGADAWEDYTGADGEVNPIESILSMPTGLQVMCLEQIGSLTFNAANPPKKMLALTLKAVQGMGWGDQNP